jgi:hypothetical protein
MQRNSVAIFTGASQCISPATAIRLAPDLREPRSIETLVQGTLDRLAESML